MATVNNIPVGLLVPAQVPLDAKLYVNNEASLLNLGTANNLAFTYYEGMIVYCVAEKRRYEWREGTVGEVGLLTTGFTYPAPLVVNGIVYSNRTFNFFYVPQDMKIQNVGGGTTWYKGLYIPTNTHQFKTFTSTGLNITSSSDEVNLESKPGINLGNGFPFYKGLNNTSKIHEFRTLVSTTARIILSQVGDQIRITSDFYDTVVTAGNGITVTGTGTALNPYIISLTPVASPWLRGDIKEVSCSAAYIAANFVASGVTAGLGTNERVGWAICNGKNGTPNDKGRVVVGYGIEGTGTNYPNVDILTYPARGGEEAHSLSIPEMPKHHHESQSILYQNIAGGDALAFDSVGDEESAKYVNVNTSDTGGDPTTGITTPHNNMQPYVVRLKIMKL
jgi:hypothetical protein